jgi:hypothetical protein
MTAEAVSSSPSAVFHRRATNIPVAVRLAATMKSPARGERVAALPGSASRTNAI